MTPHRRYTTIPFPPYRHRPGSTPHPMIDAAGHRCAGVPDDPLTVDAIDPRNWAACTAYLYGCDLYNHQYWWEAHEAWESLWHIAREQDHNQADYLRGLIQMSACALKCDVANRRGAARLYGRARTLLVGVAARARRGSYMGVRLTEWLDELDRYYEPRLAPDAAVAGHDATAFPYLRLTER